MKFFDFFKPFIKKENVCDYLFWKDNFKNIKSKNLKRSFEKYMSMIFKMIEKKNMIIEPEVNYSCILSL